MRRAPLGAGMMSCCRRFLLVVAKVCAHMMEEDRNYVCNRADHALIDVPGPRRGSFCPFPPIMDGLLPDLTTWGAMGGAPLGPCWEGLAVRLSGFQEEL